MHKYTKFLKDNAKVVHRASMAKGRSNDVWYSKSTAYSTQVRSDICFARVHEDTIARYEDYEYSHYLLRVDLDENGKIKYFDVKSLMKQLNQVFGKVFKIQWFRSDYDKDVKIIEITEKQKFNKKIMYAAYLELYVLFRCFDGEFLNRWRELENNDELPEQRVGTIQEVLYYYYCSGKGNTNHVPNDTLAAAYRSERYKEDKVFFKAAINRVVQILETAFGTDSEVEFDDKFMNEFDITRSSYGSWKRQTPLLNEIERTINKLYGRIGGKDED